MKKRVVLWIILDLIFLAVFNTVFFVVGGNDHSASVWIAYVFIHFAYMMLILTPILTRKNKSLAVLGFSIYTISSTYFFIAFIVGLIFVFESSESFKASLVTQVIIAGLYAVILVSNLIINESTKDSIEQQEVELKYVKQCSAKLKIITSKINDKALIKQIEKANDLIHSSQTKSNESVRSLELEVIELIELLDINVSSNAIDSAFETLNKIIKVAEDRNLQLRLYN